MNFIKLAQLATIACFLSACGGGSSNSASTPTPPVIITPPPYALTPSVAKTSYIAGFPSTIYLTAKQTTAFVGIAYLKVVVDSTIIQSPIAIKTTADGTFAVQITTSASASPGLYTGNLIVSVCSDANCNTHLAGSPFKVPYEIEVTSPNGGVTAYNLSRLGNLDGGKDWETFQGNASHTGYTPVTLNAAAFNPRWKWSAPSYSGIQWIPSTITTSGGKFFLSSGGSTYIGQNGYELIAYNEIDGSKAWSHSFTDIPSIYQSVNPPAVSNGKVFIVTGSQQYTAMFAFDATTGTQIFKSPMASQWEHYLAPTIANGVAYTDGGTYGGMYAFDIASGAQKFFAYLAQYDEWTPAIDSQYAYAYVGGALRIVDIVNGQSAGVINDPNFVWNGYRTNGAPVLGATGSVFAGNLSNNVTNAITNFDTINKSVRWSVKGAYSGNPAYTDGLLFAANNLPFRLEAIKESDGSLAWSWTPPTAESTSFISDVAATNNLLFVSTDTKTYAIDKSTHTTVWNYAASGSLAISANGILYIKGKNSITAINLQ